MGLGFLRGDAAVAPELGHDGVVVGELREPAVAVEVGATVAHVDHEQVLGWLDAVGAAGLVGIGFLRYDGQDHGGGAHAPQVGVVGGVVDALVRLGDDLGQRACAWVAVGLLDGLDHHPGRHLAALRTPHAVGHHVDAELGEHDEAVLVGRAQPPGVGGRAGP